MAYKKYIKKNGKIYGPYIYHSKRVDGKVVTEYKGTNKFDSKKILPFLGIFIAVFVLGFAMYLFINSNGGGLTGFSVLDLDANYQSGENLQGKLDLNLQEGELVPKTSNLIFETQNNMYEYPLEGIISEELIEGSFYVEGSNISGEGIGYGLAGKRTTYPNVTFSLLINSPGENDSIIETEIEGNVSANNTYEYALRENESAKIKPLSVSSNGEELSDDTVSLEIVNSTAIVSTEYSLLEEGFGEEYNGDGIKEISINLSQLNLSLSEGDLSVRLEYLGNNLSDLNTRLEEGSVQANVSKNTTPNISDSESLDTSNVSNDSDTSVSSDEDTSFELDEIQLTQQEQDVLESEFGNVTLEAVEAFSSNGFITLRYQLSDYWVEHSYSENLSNETLSRLMEEDRIKWLKDLAEKFLSEDTNEVSLDEFTGEYRF